LKALELKEFSLRERAEDAALAALHGAGQASRFYYTRLEFISRLGTHE
jgi:hypothetical protein